MIPYELKMDIENQFWMVDEIIRIYNPWYGKNCSYDVLLDDLNKINNFKYYDLYEAWSATDKENRREYYLKVMGY